tara:strand:+ start:673 stop:960 length:288 start_codon:yes stop_codon:yes gene_type:complete
MKNYGYKTIFLLDAVKAIKSDSNAQISGEDLSTIVWLDDNPTNITNDAIQTKYNELIAAEDAKVAAKNDDKASGKAKLKAGEALTDAEISALFED